ncbi:hypothetical protein C8F01DRAFT_1177035 [Mycena amicta]|nr:hypothetical protein C8F01DRAFT_1177027 [Mycena amicta]KAJ7050979.1 hypothetical protein C8F01DRAFT_1177035 [Mycena amicta]
MDDAGDEDNHDGNVSRPSEGREQRWKHGNGWVECLGFARRRHSLFCFLDALDCRPNVSPSAPKERADVLTHSHCFPVTPTFRSTDVFVGTVHSAHVSGASLFTAPKFHVPVLLPRCRMLRGQRCVEVDQNATRRRYSTHANDYYIRIFLTQLTSHSSPARFTLPLSSWILIIIPPGQRRRNRGAEYAPNRRRVNDSRPERVPSVTKPAGCVSM